MSIAELFKRAIVRRLAFVLVAVVLGYFGIGKASAHDVPCKASTATCDQGIAREMAYALSSAQAHCVSVWGNDPDVTAQVGTVTHLEAQAAYQAQAKCVYSNGVVISNSNELYEYVGTCADRSSSPEWANQQIGPSLTKEGCAGGCEWKLEDGFTDQGHRSYTDGTTARTYFGRKVFTPNTCGANTPDPDWKEKMKPKEQECVPVAGQTICKKKNGDSCYTSGTGRVTCWEQSETGEKTDGPNIQIKANGPEPPAQPLASPPQGAQFVNTNTTVVTTTTINNTSSVTNVSNFGTSNGAPAGGSNQGESNTGQSGNGQSGGSSGGQPGGSGNGEENTSTGGATCGSPPVSGGDQTLAQIAKQAHATRCAISDRNKAQDDSLATLSSDDGLGGVTEASIWDTGNGNGPPQILEGLLGGGGGTCPIAPQMSLFGKEIPITAEWWSLASWIGLLVVASAYLWVIQMMGK